MKHTHRNRVRLFILDQLFQDDMRLKLADLSRDYDMDDFEVMEFYENEVERITKLFNYPECS